MYHLAVVKKQINARVIDYVKFPGHRAQVTYQESTVFFVIKIALDF